MNTNKVYIFDLDGTLVDSMPIAVRIVLSLLDEQGISYSPAIIKTLIPLGYQGIAEYYANELGVQRTAKEIFAWFMQKLSASYDGEIRLKPTAKGTLFEMKKKGIRLCVLTGSPHRFVEPCLRREGVFDLFERVWSTEDFRLSKGDGRIYEQAALLLGVQTSDLVLVDDGIHALKAAREVGVTAIGAYDRYSATKEELDEAAERWVYELAELLE